MRSHRFYTAQELTVGLPTELTKEASHHCLQVLRYQAGASLTLFNGDGFDYEATIESVEGKRCMVQVENKLSPDNESPLRIHLFQGIARGEKMDLIIQKAVELGVSEITPLFSERCNVKLEGNRLEKKLAHWQNIAVSASEQSGRALIPKINSACQIKQIPTNASASHLCLEPTANQRIADSQLESTVCLYIGPEGGFSSIDLDILQRLNVVPVTLGPRILRTETAGLSCIAILQSHFGDI
jgi:16S rRNA (uracil1498-N3)-methyltransferase